MRITVGSLRFIAVVGESATERHERECDGWCMCEPRSGMLVAAAWVMLLSRAAAALPGVPDRAMRAEKLWPTGPRYEAVVLP